MSLLRVENLVKIYGKRSVVDGVSFRVEAGEIVGLLGPNGAGKTTSFRSTIGMITPDAGEVYFQDEEMVVLTGNPKAEEARGFVEGDRITIYVKENRSVVQGSEEKKVKAVIFQEQEGR